MTKEHFCYVAKHPDAPGYYAAVVDSPDWVKESAKDIADWIREGAIVQRVTSDKAREGLLEYIKYKKSKEQPDMIDFITQAAKG